ncbi:MAG: bifunctional YncE family protein/alkaline phosphatase family protein [Saprospiraceae bacterium]|nr:bifunctional YncE family protein/alkaline phosphatase family protein [Saprospiraceae bacterium]
MRIIKLFFILIPGIFYSVIHGQSPVVLIEAPAGSLPAQINRNGTTVIPNGRLLTPKGKMIQTAPHPFGLTTSRDGTIAITANSGIKPFSITIIKNIHTDQPQVMQVPKGAENDEGILEACFMGLYITNDNKLVYVSGGESNKIFKYNIETGEKTGTINCNFKSQGIDYTHGYIGDMVVTKDGKKMFVTDQIGFRIVEIDLVSEKIVRNIPTGRYPFGLALTPDESKLMVANVGMFEYKKFTDLDPADLKNTAHTFPASKYGSKRMIKGSKKEGIPPLGDPNSPEGFSVWIYDLKNNTGTSPVAKVKTGFPVGKVIDDFPAVGGASPNSIVATDKYIFVSNGNNDCISVIDIVSHSLLKNIPLQPDRRLKNLRGIIPFGLALSPDQKNLYVAESGINAIAVINTENFTVKGHIPTAWFPSKLKVSQDGKKLIVANAKGLGSGPNGGASFNLEEQGSYIGGLMKGYVTVHDIPQDNQLIEETNNVISNNFKFLTVDSETKKHPIPLLPQVKSEEIKYIVFIAKENRTYDEVFGQLPNGKGDPALARFGNGVEVQNKKNTKTIQKVDVMPNHIALARRFAISDNFFCDSDVSADGHRWMVNTYPNEWCETETAASYGGKLSMRDSSNAPGNLAIYGSAGSIYPEDYNEAGSMWEHLQRHKIDFFNFGFGVEMAGAYSDSTMKHIGELYTINYPLPAPLFDKSSNIFPTYNMAIPDQYRVDLFIKEFNERWGKKGLPPVITLMLPNDHGTSERPHAGYPFQASYMADNDLAVGRTIEFLSHTPYWKNMAIFITEDDPQGGVDHIDAHRSVMMVISPYTKKDYVGNHHYSFGSIFKTFWRILGIPSLNQYDEGATSMHDLFTNTPDFTPYNAIPIQQELFDPHKALTPIDEKFNWKEFAQSEELDRTETMQKRRNEDDKKLKEKKNKN